MKTIQKYRVSLVKDGTVKLAENFANHADDAATVFMRTLAGLPHEEMHALFVNRKNEIIGFCKVGMGGSGGIGLMACDVLRPAVVASAASVIIAHNHPSGDPAPSADDISFTRALAAAGKVLGVELLDHVVCCPERGTWLSIIDRVRP